MSLEDEFNIVVSIVRNADDYLLLYSFVSSINLLGLPLWASAVYVMLFNGHCELYYFIF
jgi:hypothetical protein